MIRKTLFKICTVEFSHWAQLWNTGKKSEFIASEQWKGYIDGKVLKGDTKGEDYS